MAGVRRDEPASLKVDERSADLIGDSRAMTGQRLTLVNTTGAPFDNSPATRPAGTPDLENRLPHPEVMEFRVSSQSVGDPFVLPAMLSSSYHRLAHDQLPPAHRHRVITMVEYPEGTLIFQELAEMRDGDAASGATLLAIANA
jgi:o-aminophenol oxidase